MLDELDLPKVKLTVPLTLAEAGAGAAETVAKVARSVKRPALTRYSLQFGGRDLRSQPGPTVDDLASALAALPGFTATTPTAVTLGGYSGKRISLTAPDGFANCTLSSDGYRLFQLPGGLVFAFGQGERADMWILDVNGERVVVALADTGQSATELTEAQAVVDSLVFEPTN